jgi:hypothetical protein
MREARRAGLVAAAIGLAQAACLVQITHVADPGPIFGVARVEADRLSGRPGRAHELNVLVWNRDDHSLVRVSLPMWLVRKAARRMEKGEWGDGGDAASDHVRDALRRVKLEDIEKAGLGILAEVQEDDGAQVLVWLR